MMIEENPVREQTERASPVRRPGRFKEYEFLFRALADKKGLNIVALDLQGTSSIADVFVLVTGNSDVHMGTLRDAALEALHRRGAASTVEGHGSSQWCLIDTGDLVVHVFSKTGRDHYKLEKIWGDAETFHYSTPD